MRKLLFPFLTLLIAIALHSSLPAQSQDDFLVIVHPQNSADAMSKKAVSKILLKKTRRWSDGLDAVPVDLPANSEVRKSFSKSVHGRSAAGIQSYWQRQIFSGNGVPPLELPTEAEVVAYVRDNAGAIGYVSAGTPVDGVKVLTLTEQ